MGRSVLVECRCNSPFCDAKASIAQLLNISITETETAMGTSWLFSAMGFDGAIYEEEVDGTRLSDTWLYLDLRNYALPDGPAFQTDVVGNFAIFVAGIISHHLKWKCRVLTEEGGVICDLAEQAVAPDRGGP